MESSEIRPGAVFRFAHDDRPQRVLLCGSDAVMYDAWWPHLDGWGLADLDAIKRKRIAYYVTTVSTLAEKSTYLRSDPLSADEVEAHRPDLPFTAVRDASLTWSSEYPGSLETQSELEASPIYLLPLGPGGGTKTGVRVAADNGSSFPTEELCHKARAAQAPHLGAGLPAGVGIYRSGLQRGLPAYYLWGSASRSHEPSL